jgi:hypothetical protein
MTCDLIADVASLTGWDKETILNLPLHEALYYQLKQHNQNGHLSEWVL